MKSYSKHGSKKDRGGKSTEKLYLGESIGEGKQKRTIFEHTQVKSKYFNQRGYATAFTFGLDTDIEDEPIDTDTDLI